MIINSLQATILEYLATYQYLSVVQLATLTGKSLSYLRSQLAIMSQRKLIKSFHVEIAAQVRAPNIYYLLPFGRECLLTHEKAFAEITNMPLSTSVVIIRDYFHRVGVVDIHISISLYCQQHNIDLLLFHTYFQKLGNNRKDHNLEAKTKVQFDEKSELFYIPDAIAISENGGKEKIWIIEFFNDKSTLRILQSLAGSAKAISLASFSRKYDMPVDPIVLSVFTYDGIKEAVIERLLANEKFAKISGQFFFASLTDVKGNFNDAFISITGEKLLFK